MSCTPPHPNLLLDRAMTPDEMIDCLNYEGLFGIGELDLPVARQLASEDKILLDLWDKGRGWHVCKKD